MNKIEINNGAKLDKNTTQTNLGDKVSDDVYAILSKEDIDSIFDLDLLSSEEYILTQFNFLKTIGEFINFLETNNGDLRYIKQEFKEILIDFLGDDYEKIIKFFEKYPLDFDIETSKFENIINKTANLIDFAKLSFISPIIEKLNKELKKFQEETPKMMAMLDTIPKVEEMFNNSIGELSKRIYKNKDNSKPENLLYSLEHNYGHEEDKNGDIIKEYQNYTFIREYLDSITGHAGIIPLLIQKGMITKSGLLNKNETIKIIRPKKILLPGNNITFERNGNKVTIKDSETGEIYSESKIKKEFYIKKIPSEEGIDLGKEIQEYDEKIIMHDDFWHYIFSKEIPLELCNDRLIPLDSALLEHIGFRLLNGLLTNEDNIKRLKDKVNNKKLNKIDFNKLKGIFASVEEVHLNPDFKRLIKENRTPIIKIISAKPARGPVKFDIEVITNDKKTLIGKYKIMIA